MFVYLHLSCVVFFQFMQRVVAREQIATQKVEEAGLFRIYFLQEITTMEVNWNGPQDSVRWWLSNYVCNRYPKVKFLCEECGDTSTHV